MFNKIFNLLNWCMAHKVQCDDQNCMALVIVLEYIPNINTIIDISGIEFLIEEVSVVNMSEQHKVPCSGDSAADEGPLSLLWGQARRQVVISAVTLDNSEHWVFLFR